MNNKEIRIVALLILDTVFFLLEAIIGYTVHSLALIADSFHMLNDIISLIIALWAVRVKNTKPADGKYTYGWQRAEILGALINAVFLLALCFTIIMDAIQRFFEPQEISNPKLILIVGIAGLLSNGVGLVLFHEHGHSHSHGGSHESGLSHSHSHTDAAATEDEEETVGAEVNENTSLLHQSHSMGSSPSEVFDYLPDNVVERYHKASISGPVPEHEEINASTGHNDTGKKKFKKKSMNMEGVFLHVLGDALGNIGVIITGLVVWKTDYSWRFLADPFTSLFITLIILNSALPLVRKASRILLQSAPPYIDAHVIVEQIKKLPLIKNVHDFHVWNLNEDILIATLHIELNPNCEVNLPLPPVTNGDGTNSSSDDEFPSQIDRKLFLAAVHQVREVLLRYGINSVTIQPEFQTSKGCKSIFGQHV
ncbi:ZRC1 Zinc/cadmium resistance protein [Candida maltosa Xu316]